VRQSIAIVRNGTTTAAALLVALALTACGEKEEPSATQEPPETAPAPATPREPATQDGERERVEGDSGGGAPKVLSRSERLAVRAAEDYVSAIDARRGSEICRLLVPGAIDQIDLPRERGGCAASLEISLGYRDPRGFPVWQSSMLEAVDSVDTEGDDATVFATVFTRFADRPEPSIEDDPIYLRRDGGRWLVAQPSLTLYRAVGIAEPPPAVISPPEG
jgi:hypothetical protein